jgi:hypothetical protein
VVSLSSSLPRSSSLSFPPRPESSCLPIAPPRNTSFEGMRIRAGSRDYLSGKKASTPGLPFEQLGLGKCVTVCARATPVNDSNPVPLQRICPCIVMSELLVLSQLRPSHVTPGAGVVLGDAMALLGAKALEVAISAATRMPRPTAR